MSLVPGRGSGEVVTERLADARRRHRRGGMGLAQAPGRQLAGAARLYGRRPDVRRRMGLRPRSKHVTPDDDEAIRLCLDEERVARATPGPPQAMTATVTPIGSRSGLAGSHQPDRTHADRTAGGAALHPSRQAAGVAAGTALGRPARLTGQAGEIVHPRPAERAGRGRGGDGLSPGSPCAPTARRQARPGTVRHRARTRLLPPRPSQRRRARSRRSFAGRRRGQPSRRAAAQAAAPGDHRCHPGTRSCSATPASPTDAVQASRLADRHGALRPPA